MKTQQYKDVLINLENRRGVKEGLHEYKGFTISVHHFHSTTGLYRLLHLDKEFSSIKSAYKYIDKLK